MGNKDSKGNPMPPQPPPPPSVPSTPDQDERIIGQPSSEPLTTQPSILIHLSAQPTMEKEEAAQPSTQSIMVMKPQIHSSTELSAQKKMVKLGLTRERSSGQIWAPLALDWFQTWKQYVDFDDACVEPRINDVLRSLHPGPVDNSSLHVGAYGDELLRGFDENKDYVLLPDDVFKMLIKEYTGGPHFGRKVLNKGKIWAPNYFVDLYPIRFEVCLCTKPVPGMYYLVKPPIAGGNDPDIDNYTATTVKPDKIVYYPSNFDLTHFCEEMRKTMKVGVGSIRVWVKVQILPPTTTVASSSLPSSSMPSITSLPDHQNSRVNDDDDNGGSIKHVCTHVGRLMTADVTDLLGSPWRLLRDTKGLVAADLLGDQECLRILVEHHHERMIQDGEWPRYAVLQRWKRSLQLGDVVDAQDKLGKWYEAIITDISPGENGGDNNASSSGDDLLNLPSVGVHFNGWDIKYDELIPSASVSQRIQPLYTKSMREENSYRQSLVRKISDEDNDPGGAGRRRLDAMIESMVAAVRDKCEPCVHAIAAEQRTINMHAEIANWEEEKQRIANNYCFEPKIKLDVGGHTFSTTQTTLTRFPNSMLGAMFSGRHALLKDQDGAYFIDRDGRYFHEILNFLRGATTSTQKSMEHRLSPAELEELKIEADFYGLDDVMFPKPSEI